MTVHENVEVGALIAGRAPRVAYMALNPSHSAMQTKFAAQQSALRELAREGSVSYVSTMSTRALSSGKDMHSLGASSVTFSRGRRLSRAKSWAWDYNKLLRMVDREVRSQDIDILYMRKPPGFDRRTIWALRRIRNSGVRVALEIPTFPYDNELAHRPFTLSIDRDARRLLSSAVDAIVTVSEDDEIFGVPTIKIDNGVDLNSVPLRSQALSEDGIDLISVSSLCWWHRLDRVVTALRAYWDRGGTGVRTLQIVGKGPAREQLRELAAGEHRIVFHDPLYGAELDELVDMSSLGIGVLAESSDHSVRRFSSLKHREYAGRGLPFIYGPRDDAFAGCDYVLRVPDGELDVEGILRWRAALRREPREIRSDAGRLSWSNQMRKVLESPLLQGR